MISKRKGTWNSTFGRESATPCLGAVVNKTSGSFEENSTKVFLDLPVVQMECTVAAVIVVVVAVVIREVRLQREK